MLHHIPLKNLAFIFTVIECITCVVAFLYWKKLRGTTFKLFPAYLLLIVTAEFFGYYLRTYDMKDMNKLFYNVLVIPVEFLFFFHIFYQSGKGKKDKRLPVVFTIIYAGAWMIDNLYLTNKLFWFYSFSYTVGNLLLLVLILRSLTRLVLSDDILFFRQNMLFWVCTGLLVFYLGTFPFYGLKNTLVHDYIDVYWSYYYIVYILNCLMYLLFALGFIWGKPKSTSL